ncbi:hypothetical protein, partial [Escherichia coli]|uniref:hypothetical protein n=2 Tax=Escherichia coli TaxID=562 RepID=UPI002158FCFB
ICSPMTSLKTSIKTITYLSDIGCLEIQGASLQSNNSRKTEGVKTTPAAKNYLCQYSIASIENGRLGALRVQGYAQVTLYADSFKANRLNGTYLISPKLNANGKFMMADDKSKVYAYDSWLLNFAISDRITRTTEQWDRCKLNQK